MSTVSCISKRARMTSDPALRHSREMKRYGSRSNASVLSNARVRGVVAITVLVSQQHVGRMDAMRCSACPSADAVVKSEDADRRFRALLGRVNVHHCETAFAKRFGYVTIKLRVMRHRPSIFGLKSLMRGGGL